MTVPGSTVTFLLLIAAVGVKVSCETCPRVHSITGTVRQLCNLNATLPCSENRSRALQACIPGAIVLALFLLFFTVALITCIACIYVVRRKKASASSSDKFEGTERLLDNPPDEGQVKTAPVKIHPKYEPPTTARDKGSVHTSNSHRRLSVSRRISVSQRLSVSRRLSSISRPNSAYSGTELSDMSSIGIEERNQSREKDIKQEKAVTDKLSKTIFNQAKLKKLPDLGSRLMKYWYTREYKQSKKRLQITVSVSKKCKLDLENPNTVDILRTLFKHLTHQHLLTVYDVAYVDQHVSFEITYAPMGSVRDQLYLANPFDDWAMKYSVEDGEREFSTSDIRLCGRQVLEAAEVLYGIGFPFIGQIHSGNVFVFENNCYALGGFENTLLGYRTRCFQILKEEDWLDQIDAIMFGHLIYQMATKRSLIEKRIFPTDYDYENIEEEIKEVLHHIFKTARKRKKNQVLMKEISSHPFFQKQLAENQETIQLSDMPPEVVELLSRVFPSVPSDVVDSGYTELNWGKIVLHLDGKYTDVLPLSSLGWRFGKIWAKASSKTLGKSGLLSAVIVPHTCPIFIEPSMLSIKHLLLLEHDHVHNLYDVDYIKIDGTHVIITFQEFVEEGSLKDILHNNPPIAEWDSKYQKKGKVQKREEIAVKGGQILNAMSHLSHLDGCFNPFSLGFVHTGNIFVDDGKCRLGGFENVLLGHRTRHFKLFEGCKAQLDVFMFGHVIFEMCTGKELATAVPSDKELKDVPNDIKPVLKFIFEDESAEIDKIMEHPFFSPACIFPAMEIKKELDENSILLLKKVRKGKSRDQNNQKEKLKYMANFKISKATSKLHKH